MLTLDISLPNGVITKPCSFEVKKTHKHTGRIKDSRWKSSIDLLVSCCIDISHQILTLIQDQIRTIILRIRKNDQQYTSFTPVERIKIFVFKESNVGTGSCSVSELSASIDFVDTPSSGIRVGKDFFFERSQDGDGWR